MYFDNTLERAGVFLDKGILVESFAKPLVKFNPLSSNRAQEVPGSIPTWSSAELRATFFCHTYTVYGNERQAVGVVSQNAISRDTIYFSGAKTVQTTAPLTLSSLGFFEHSQPGGGGDSAPPPHRNFLLLMQIK